MKLIIQRVTEASVTIDGRVTGKIGKGYMVLIGVGREDNEETARKYVDKMLKLRIFEDENGKTNLSISQVDGAFTGITVYTVCRYKLQQTRLYTGSTSRYGGKAV